MSAGRPTEGFPVVEFVCPVCWARTDLPDEWAGKRARCPECHASGDVPALQAREKGKGKGKDSADRKGVKKRRKA
jgi:hypothetical protein